MFPVLERNSRFIPGAILAAIIAASIGKVPLPQNGSTRMRSLFHGVNMMSAAARVSCDRRFTCECAVTALVQGLTRRIKGHRHRILVEEDTKREARTVLREPLNPVRLFHPLHHSLFHDGLDI